jgi:branched-chain amino acid transport system permease protein
MIPSSAASLPSRALSVAIVVTVALGLPFLVPNYYILQATMVLIYAVTLLGLNILTGYNGQISLGHGAFYGIGAYATCILMVQTGMPYWATVPLAGAICLVGGFLFGIPALRLEGLYLALATFALAIVLPQILKHPALKKWTGGFEGLSIGSVPVPSYVSLNADQWLYLFCLLVTAVMFLFGWNLLRGRSGRAMIAIRENPTAATSMGINAAFYKSATFGVSAMFAGVAGSLSALAAQFVSPDSFTFFLSITFFVGVVVGGIATFWGAFFGAIFIQFVPNVADHISKAAPWAVYGIALIGCMFLMPTGIVGGYRKFRDSLFSERVPVPSADDSAAIDRVGKKRR